jgi:hypothetical protein
MALKKLSLAVLMVFSSLITFGQDKIFKKNGDVIEAKVMVINTRDIVFKKFNNQDGPDYSVPKKDVLKIKYQNGTEDSFEGNLDPTSTTKKAGRSSGVNSIISFAPLQLTDNGVGAGIQWEHFLDKSGYVSIYLPVMVTFNIANSDLGPGIINSGSSSGDAMYYFMPGIKIYPNPHTSKRVQFSLGPSLFIASGRGVNQNETFGPYSSYSGYQDQSHFMLGVMINAGFNFFSAKKLYFGFDGGLGLTYQNEYGGVSAGTTEVAQDR